MPSKRAEVFVVSPMAVYSSRRADPTLPDMTSPVLRPMPILKPSPRPSSRIHALKRSSLSSIIARRPERLVGVVVGGDRRAEDGHDPVAHVGDERAVVVEDRVAHLGQVAVQHADHLGRLAALGEAREAAQVAEQHGRGQQLAAEADVVLGVGALEHLGDHGVGHEAREQVARLGALDRGGHPVHRERAHEREPEPDQRHHHRQDQALPERELGDDDVDERRRRGRARARAAAAAAARAAPAPA